ncbi:MAG: DMT family transporter [Muricomes sp.]
MKNTTKAYLAITLYALIVGLSFLTAKIALTSADAIGLLANRFTMAAISALIYKFFRPDSISADFSSWVKIVPFSMVYPIAFFLLQTFGLSMIPSSEAGIIYATVPILTLIVARIILNERINMQKKILMLVSVLGVVFINVMNGVNIGDYNYWGFLLVLLSTMTLATYNVFAKKLIKDYSAVTIVYIMSITGCVVFNAISVVQHLLKGNIGDYFKPYTSVSFVLAVIYLGVFSSLITTILSAYALKSLEATKVGLFNNVSTVVSILAGTLFLHEPLYYYHYIGIIVILIGTIGFNLNGFGKFSSKTKKKES